LPRNRIGPDRGRRGARSPAGAGHRRRAGGRCRPLLHDRRRDRRVDVPSRTDGALSMMRIQISRMRSSSMWWHAARYARMRIGLTLVLLVVALALIGPLVAGPTRDFVSAPFASPSQQCPFGTDVL